MLRSLPGVDSPAAERASGMLRVGAGYQDGMADQERINMAEHEHQDKTAARDDRPRDSQLNASADAPAVPDPERPDLPAGTFPPGAHDEGPTTPGAKIAREQAEDRAALADTRAREAAARRADGDE